MSTIPQSALSRLALCSQELKAKMLRTEAQRCRESVASLSAEELAAETVRAGACLNVALDKLAIAVREMRYADAETELQRALSFSAWAGACHEASASSPQLLAA